MKSTVKTDQQWLKVLGKGMVTIPKKWRLALNINIGNMVKAQKVGDSLVIEPADKPAPYRVYSQAELESFIAEDQIEPRKK